MLAPPNTHSHRTTRHARTTMIISTYSTEHRTRGLTRVAARATRAVVPECVRSYPSPRGRTRMHAVVPGCTRSYLREALRYDSARKGTTARSCVRPSGTAYDPAHEGTTTRHPDAPNHQRTATPTTLRNTKASCGLRDSEVSEMRERGAALPAPPMRTTDIDEVARLKSGIRVRHQRARHPPSSTCRSLWRAVRVSLSGRWP